jgi:protein O-GlcNAc transferase
MGVPVVTLKGNTHAQNVGASLLSSIGYSWLIAKTQEEYIKLAVDLANDIPKLQEIRKSLRAAMKSSPLCDGRKFTENLEKVYKNMWDKFLAKSRVTTATIVPAEQKKL